MIESIEYRGYTIEIHQDEYGENPMIEWDGNVEFCCWHSRYTLGNSKRFGNGLGDVEDCQAYAKETNSILLPLFIYEHGGIALSLGRDYPFNCQWDSGQLGYILIDREWMKEYFGTKYFTKKMRARMLKAAYGFYGYDHKKSGLLECAESTIDYDIEDNKKKHFALLKKWIINKVPLQYREPLTV